MANFYAWQFDKWSRCYYCDDISSGCIMWSSESRAVCQKCLNEQYLMIAMDEMVNG